MTARYWYIIAIYVLAQFSSVIGVPILTSLGLKQDYSISIWAVFSFFVATLIIIFLLKPDMKQASEVRERSSAGNIALWSFLGVFLAYFAQIIAILIETFLLGIKPGSQNTQELMEFARLSPLFILVMVLFAPILEEIIFRKIIFGSIYKRTNFIIAVIVSALAFAASHFDFTHMIVYMAMGIVFAYLYVKTKSIITPIIAHMAMNTVVVIGQYSMSEEDFRRMQEQFEQLQTIFGGLLL
ncbi:CPBP family intramembrane glutamic endopeptidase [Thalassobacillus pellis]|uniref:CPBP family intramembrane glutamic endopeptidase n=1 Tax=Thalassobacillus pellis TaxID=748008 RepID=UPI001961BAB1|nr:type II CAAX endopeptidase family protein [Thalassobacillus pellis]MBM7553261.1 membrane protease YdiL (CAAX protease family) [Thalassobacillus pellis]